MEAERAGLLLAALADDAAALDTLLSACGVDIPDAAFEHVRSRVAGWLQSLRQTESNDGGSDTWEDLQAVVRSHVRDVRIRELLAEGRFEEVHKLVQRELRGMIRMRVPFQDADDVIQQVWVEALGSYHPDKGALIPFVRVIARRLAFRYWADRHLPLEEVAEPAVEPAGLPPSECFEALLSIVVRDEPHKALVFILSKAVDMPPREIDEVYGKTPLGELVDVVERRYFEDGWNSPGARRCFRALRDSLPFPVSERRLRSFYTRDAQRTLSAWTDDVWRKLRRALATMQAEFLTLVFSLHFDPHKILTYAYLGLLCWPPQDLWSSSHAALYELRNSFPAHYPPQELDDERLARCLSPLNEQLDRPLLSPSGRSTLAERAGDQMVTALSGWRWEVNKTVCRRAGEEGLHAIAYINGAVERRRPGAGRKAAAQ